MLREFQEEIKRLKEQLEATQSGVMIDADGKVFLSTIQVLLRNVPIWQCSFCVANTYRQCETRNRREDC